MPKTLDYNVALRYRKHVEGYAGVVYWTSFNDKAAFDSWYVSQKDNVEIAGEGISVEECVALVHTTPPGSRVEVAYYNSTHPVTGEIDDDALASNLVIAEHAIRMAQR